MTTSLSRGGEERGKYACTQPLSVWRAPTLDERWLRLMPLAAYWLLPANQGQVFLQSSARKNYSDSSNVFLSVNPKTGFKSCNGFCVPFGKSKSGFLMFWILFEKGFIEFEIRRIRIQINGLVIYAVPFTVQDRSYHEARRVSCLVLILAFFFFEETSNLVPNKHGLRGWMDLP